MRSAVISDIHGDLDSLRSVLTGATAPAEVVDLVRDRCALALAGNHDRWVTGQLSLSMLPLPRQRAQLQWQHLCSPTSSSRSRRASGPRA